MITKKRIISGVLILCVACQCVFWMTSINVNAQSYDSEYLAEQERVFRENLNANYNPSDYDDMPDYYKEGDYCVGDDTVRTCSELSSVALETVKNCKTDEEKVKDIHDWIAINFAYDYETYNKVHAGRPSFCEAVEKRVAVCEQYSKVARIMYASVGVPCMVITGTAITSCGVEPHAWNAVYVDGEWKFIDITWDSRNKYFGDGNSNNTRNMDPVYSYYEASMEFFSRSHISEEICYEDKYKAGFEYVDSVKIDWDSIPASMTSGDTFYIKYKVEPATAVDQSVTWKSSNTGVAKIDQDGKVTVVRGGNVVFEVSANNNDGIGKYHPYDVTTPFSASNPGENRFYPLITEGPEGTMYRLYNPNSGEHLYTADINETQSLANIGWDYENYAWQAPTFSNTPVYRVYNQNSGEHHYTSDMKEVSMLVSLGWNDEGIKFYSDDNHGTPMYRLYNPNATGQYEAGGHHYTKDEAERDYLISIGWRDEGIGWYGM